MVTRLVSYLAATALMLAPASGQQTHPEPLPPRQNQEAMHPPALAPADRILQAQADPQLRALLADALDRNADVAAAQARARAAEFRAPQMRALPDPVAGVTAYIQSPETRTGPQRLMLTLSQSIPWLSKLDLKEQAARLDAAALDADAEAKRLELVTEVRRVYYELAFLVQYKEITLDFRDHLAQHEEISLARYATGQGSSQAVVKLQAATTRAENLVLDIDSRRVDLEARLNALLDRPANTAILPARPPDAVEQELTFGSLLQTAERRRPELAAADARIARAEALVRIAEKEYRPNFVGGLTYTFVDPRTDAAAQLMPPAGNGDDIFGIQAGVSLPVWRKRLAAGVDEANQLELVAREAKRGLLAKIEAAIGDHLQRLPLTWKQLRLLEDVLVVQAEEAVDSAEGGYISGALNALDLLDSEHVLYEAQTSVARANADYAIRCAELEGALGDPLQLNDSTEQATP